MCKARMENVMLDKLDDELCLTKQSMAVLNET